MSKSDRFTKTLPGTQTEHLSLGSGYLSTSFDSSQIPSRSQAKGQNQENVRQVSERKNHLPGLQPHHRCGHLTSNDGNLDPVLWLQRTRTEQSLSTLMAEKCSCSYYGRFRNTSKVMSSCYYNETTHSFTTDSMWWTRSEPGASGQFTNEYFKGSSTDVSSEINQNSQISQLQSQGHSFYQTCSVHDSLDTTNSFSESLRSYLIDPQTYVCNIFWKSGLSFHPYTSPDSPVDFGSLWPDKQELELTLGEAFLEPGLRRMIGDIAWVVIYCGPLRALKVLLDLKLIGIHHIFRDGRSLLHKASIANNMSAVQYLLKCGADLHLRDQTGHTARQLCYSTRMMRLLNEPSGPMAGGLCNIIASATPIPRPKVKVEASLHDKQLIFDLAQNYQDTDDIMLKLQKYDFDVNVETDDHGDFLIHLATKQGVSQVALLSLLVKVCHADINLTNHEGFTCVMLAAIMGNATLVDTLLCVFGADPDVPNPASMRTALHYACQRNELDAVSVLLKRGADYNLEDGDGARPDDLAVIFKAHDCVSLIQRHREQRIQHLMSLLYKDELSESDIRTTDLYLTDSEGYTLLMTAARNNCVDTLAWLAQAPGVPLNAQHEQTLKTALSYAAKWGHVEAVRLLIREGASPVIRDISGNLPLHNAVIHHQVAAVTEILQYPQALIGLYRALEESKHPVIQREIKSAITRRQKDIILPLLFEASVTGDVSKLLDSLEEGDNVNPLNSFGDWPIYLATENGHLDVVELLYEYGGDIQGRHSRTGNSLLHASCHRGHLEVTDYILSHCKKCAANRSAEPGGMVNALNFRKDTPLVIAASKGHMKLVQLLLKHGASSQVLSPLTGRLYRCEEYEGIQFIIESHRKQHTADITAAIAEWKPLRRLQQIFLPQFDHNLRTASGDTPLMVACRLGKIDVVRFLLQSATYEVFPSPPSMLQLSKYNYDSDADSGAVLDTNKTVSSGNGLTTSKLPRNHSSPVIHHNPLQQEVCVTAEITGNPQTRMDSQKEDLKITEPRNHPQSEGATTSAAVPVSFYMPPDTAEEEELAMNDNISSLLDSIASVSRGSVFINHKKVSHLCAVSSHDGATAFHRTIEGGDNVAIINALLDYDQSAVNIQDSSGLSPLHLACKLSRKKVVATLVSVTPVDLNSRTLDGKLPEEMASAKSIISLVEKTRKQQPIKSAFSALRSLPTSIFGDGSVSSTEEGGLDFDLLNTRFALIRHDFTTDINLFL